MLLKIATLYAERLMSDICLVVGGTEYPAHRLILCASSEVFQVWSIVLYRICNAYMKTALCQFFFLKCSNWQHCVQLEEKGKVISVYAMKAYMGSGSIVPVILIVSTKWRWVVSSMFQVLV